MYVKDRQLQRAEFTEVFEAFFSRPSSNKRAMVAGRGFEPLKAFAGDFTDRSLWPLGHPASAAQGYRSAAGAGARGRLGGTAEQRRAGAAGSRTKTGAHRLLR